MVKKESQEPLTADSKKMIDQQTTLQQAETTDEQKPYSMALQYILQCLADRRASNYPVTDERKMMIGDIHQEYQIEMDKQAEMKKKKSSTMLIQPAVPPKYQMKPGPIITTTTGMQAPAISIRTWLGAAG
uniref:Uncharacterized protein n=1 Tax=Romanomermis culicivorax TaxID=13658 RepID=A0A915J6J4_ROMCU